MITARDFGILPDGRKVTCYRLTGGDDAFAEVLDYGGTIRSVVVPDREGKPVEVVLGYDDLQGYIEGTCFFGATVGRHANRIGNAAFTLNGRTYSLAKNNGPNNLHGGPEGFDRRLFTGEVIGDRLRLSLVSPHMDQGFPGELRLTVTFRFSSENALSIRYEAVCDQDTVANFTNHSYFDLSGGVSPMGQLLRLDADRFCEGDKNTLPTGHLLDVAGTPFDFRTEKPVGRDVDADDIQLTLAQQYNVSGALIVTTPQKVAFADVLRAAMMFREEALQIPIYGLVENMAYFTPSDMPEKKYYIFGKETGQQFAEQLDVPLLGQIPITEKIAECGDAGTPLALDADSPVTKAFDKIAHAIINA